MKYLALCSALAATLMFPPPRADACTVLKGVRDRVVAPADGSEVVAVNAEIRVAYTAWFDTNDIHVGNSFRNAVQVREAGGDRVDAQVDTVRTGSRLTLVVRPRALLAPNTRYEVLDRALAPCWQPHPALCVGDEAKVVATFTTGEQEDVRAPIFAGLASLDSTPYRSGPQNSCGTWTAVNLRLAWDPAEDDSNDADVAYNVYTASGDLVYAYVHEREALGEILCSGAKRPLPDFVAATDSYLVRAVDVAGNEDANDVRFDAASCAGVPGTPYPIEPGTADFRDSASETPEVDDPTLPSDLETDELASGGCAVGHDRVPTNGWLLVALSLLGLATRRRRARL